MRKTQLPLCLALVAILGGCGEDVFPCDDGDPGCEEVDFDTVEQASSLTFAEIRIYSEAPGGGPYPGPEIDAIRLRRENPGNRPYDYYLRGFTRGYRFEGDISYNYASDRTAVFGPPDTKCQFDPEKFFAMGGAGSYFTAYFGTATSNVPIQAGDVITIYEIGYAMCPSPNWWWEDMYEVALVYYQDGERKLISVGYHSGQASFTVPYIRQ